MTNSRLIYVTSFETMKQNKADSKTNLSGFVFFRLIYMFIRPHYPLSYTLFTSHETVKSTNS
ncbi:hypothetical protein EV213_12032 [Aureibacillus halotolerans]|uniref:Uncharacterized protein n=1 Tax=Aureibacillus halotolerans TaxID=1508390 RepID=A0A4R6TS49_9BACI|nr:hypothetical protein EV213_12032 [Aureibacillus halotolerans]